MKAERNLGHKANNQKRFSKKGFSLVELMTVVAIVGGLAALGVPQYRKFQRKARRAEANMVLGVTGNGVLAYLAEYNAVTNSLGALGVEMARRPLFYTFGFPTAACADAEMRISVNGLELAATPPAGFAQPNYNTAQIPGHLRASGNAEPGTRIEHLLPEAYRNNANGFDPPGGAARTCREGIVFGPSPRGGGFLPDGFWPTASGWIGGNQSDQLDMNANRVIRIRQDGT